MISGAKPALLLACCLAVPLCLIAQLRDETGIAPAPARVVQTSTSSYRTLAEPSLLSANEGLSVIGAALESRGRGHAGLDCSHLVHAVYERAGFPYSYVSSSDLYAGIEEFHRVQKIQPGDLVVWPGHVGIVVSPSQKTFFSSLTAGRGVESYDSSYWKSRGTPRFYRYVTVPGSIHRETNPQTTPGLQRAALAAREDLATRPPAEAAAPDLPFSSLPSSSLTPSAPALPRVQIIASPKPKPEQVTAALRLALESDTDSLRDADLFMITRPLVVVSKIETRNIKIHGNQGQATVRITSLLSADREEIDLAKQQQTRTWTLQRHDRKSWEIMFPQDALYVRRDLAVQALARQLARLAEAEDSAANFRQKSQLAQMLNAILAAPK